MPSDRTLTPAHVLAVFAEPLVSGRKCALVGVDDGSVGELLSRLGARLLHHYDPRVEPATTRREPTRVPVFPFRAGDLGARDHAFDVVIAPDLAALGEPEAALAQIRRLLGVDGVALIACRNEDVRTPWTHAPDSIAKPPSYGEFYDLCTLQFGEVRMLGAAPFAAYAVAEFAPEDEPQVAFDASLVDAPDAPEWFVAIASQSPVTDLEAYEVLQIPRNAVYTQSTGQSAVIEQKLKEAEARAGEEYVRAERLATDLRRESEESRKLRERTARLAKDVEEKQKLDETALAKNKAEQNTLQARIVELEAQLIEARTQLATPRTVATDVSKVQQERDRFAAEVANLRQSAQQLTAARDEAARRLQDRERELEASLMRAKMLEDRLAEELAQSSVSAQEETETIAKLTERAALAEALATRLGAELSSIQATIEEDVQTLERALRDRGEELRAAKIELVRRERLVRELVGQIEDSQRGEVAIQTPVAAVRPEVLEQLDLARRELAGLVEEIRLRDRAIEEARVSLAKAQTALESERAKTETLARDAARREAALQTASWRIAELEKLSVGPEPTAGETNHEDRKRLESELDALRRALAQEHARSQELARRLEVSGGDAAELTRALARLSEREALIAQLSAELAARRT